MIAGDIPEKITFQRFFETWLVRHMMDDYRKYGVYLNAKGVY